MRCELIGEMMSARLDDRLTSFERKALDDHLAACSNCRGEWEALSSVDRFLVVAPVALAPMNLHVQVLARLERRHRARRALIGGSTLTMGTILLALLTVSPVLGALASAGSLLPTWYGGGREAVGQMVSLLGTAVRMGAVLLRAFALPVAGIAVCVVVFAVILNGLWVGALYRLRPTR